MVFLTGAMAQEPVLSEFFGQADLPITTPASMTGCALHREEGSKSCFPILFPRDGANCKGVLLSLKDEEEQCFRKISYLAEVLGMVPVPKHLNTSDGHQAAITFIATGAAQGTSGFDPKDWRRKWARIAKFATREILSYEGRWPAQELDWRMGMILTRAAARAAAETHPAPATVRSATAREAVRVAHAHHPHEGFFLTRSYELQPPRFDGAQSAVLHREVFVAADAALVLPYDPVTDRVLLIEQFRMGPFGRGDPLPFVLEPVAGHVDAGESPEDAAQRETQEEAGLTLRGLEHISTHYCSPGCSTEVFHCYLGLADLHEPGQGKGGLGTENEDIRTHVLEFEAAEALIATGEMNIGPLVLMMFWLAQHRDRLRATA